MIDPRIIALAEAAAEKDAEQKLPHRHNPKGSAEKVNAMLDFMAACRALIDAVLAEKETK